MDHHHISATAWFQSWQPQGRFSITSPGCLGFPVVKSTSLKIFFNCIHPMNLFSFHPACISWGLMTTVVLKVERVSLMPNHRLVDQSSVYMFSRDSVVLLYTRTLGIHFSRLLRHAWTTLTLFFFPATQEETSHEYPSTFTVQSRHILLRMKNISDKSCTENQMFQTKVVQKIKYFRQKLYRKSNVSDKSCTENRNTRFMFGNVFPKFV